MKHLLNASALLVLFSCQASAQWTEVTYYLDEFTVVRGISALVTNNTNSTQSLSYGTVYCPYSQWVVNTIFSDPETLPQLRSGFTEVINNSDSIVVYGGTASVAPLSALRLNFEFDTESGENNWRNYSTNDDVYRQRYWESYVTFTYESVPISE